MHNILYKFDIHNEMASLKQSSVYMSPFLVTESVDGAEKEMPWHEGMSCEGLPYGGICTALKAVVSSRYE